MLRALFHLVIVCYNINKCPAHARSSTKKDKDAAQDPKQQETLLASRLAKQKATEGTNQSNIVQSCSFIVCTCTFARAVLSNLLMQMRRFYSFNEG
jgi:hypothetical protein